MKAVAAAVAVAVVVVAVSSRPPTTPTTRSQPTPATRTPPPMILVATCRHRMQTSPRCPLIPRIPPMRNMDRGTTARDVPSIQLTIVRSSTTRAGTAITGMTKGATMTRLTAVMPSLQLTAGTKCVIQMGDTQTAGICRSILAGKQIVDT